MLPILKTLIFQNAKLMHFLKLAAENYFLKLMADNYFLNFETENYFLKFMAANYFVKQNRYILNLKFSWNLIVGCNEEICRL